MTFERVIKNFSERGLRIRDIEEYLDSGGDINRHDERMQYTLLHFAAESCDGRTIEFLASRGADLEARDRNGWTPIHTAADSDLDSSSRDGRAATDLPTVRALLQVGADASARTSDGKTPRDIARDYGQEVLYDSVSKLSQTKAS